MRRIGPVGTALRVTVGLGLHYLTGGANGLSWAVEWYDLVLALLALPALTVVAGVAVRRYAVHPLRFTGPLGHALNCAVIVALVAHPYTGAAATLFYGAALLGAAWRGVRGCEMTVLSNWILRRDDQVGCPSSRRSMPSRRDIGRAGREDPWLRMTDCCPHGGRRTPSSSGWFSR